MPAQTDRPAISPIHEGAPIRRPDARRTQIDRALFERRDRGDRGARDALIERFMPLARSIARRYEARGVPLEDLVQVACLGLVNAVDRYDPQRGCAFSSFAVPTITGELKRYFRDRTWAIRPPRDLQERSLRIETAASELTARLDRRPTVTELADTLNCSDEQILEGLKPLLTRSSLSLDAPTATQDDHRAMLQDTVGASEDGYQHAETRADLTQLLRILPARTRLVLRLRLERELTQAEIGELLGVSQMQISRIIRGALHKLNLVATHHDQQDAKQHHIAA